MPYFKGSGSIVRATFPPSPLPFVSIVALFRRKIDATDAFILVEIPRIFYPLW